MITHENVTMRLKKHPLVFIVDDETEIREIEEHAIDAYITMLDQNIIADNNVVEIVITIKDASGGPINQLVGGLCVYQDDSYQGVEYRFHHFDTNYNEKYNPEYSLVEFYTGKELSESPSDKLEQFVKLRKSELTTEN